MSKTKEVTIYCIEAHVRPHGYNKVKVVIEDPDVDDALSSFHEDDLSEYVRDNFDCDQVFDKKHLDKWAEENGYTK